VLINTSIQSRSTSSQMYAYCISFLRASIEQAKIIYENQECSTWPDASVVLFLWSHSVELFYKAIIIHLNGNLECNHDLFRLAKEFNRVYPNSTSFDHPFKFEFIGSFTLSEISKHIEKSIKPSILYRYPAGAKGKSSSGIYAYEPLGMLKKMQEYSIVFEKVATEIDLA